MPRQKNNEKKLALPEYLVANHAKSHVFCTLCNGPSVPPFDESSREWISMDKFSRHLQSKGHVKAAAQIQADTIDEESRARAQREDEVTRVRLDAHIAASSRFTGQSNLPLALDGRPKHQPEDTPRIEIDHMFDSYPYNESDFVFDTNKDGASEKQKLQQAINEFGLWNAEATAAALGMSDEQQALDDEEEDDGLLTEIMMEHAPEAPPPELVQHGFKKTSNYFPYDSKTMFLLDTMDNLARLRISNSLMRVFLLVLKECGARDVPSFDRLREVQKALRTSCSVPTVPCESPLGNIFFLNDPRTLIAKDWANPAVRKHIRVYPEIPEDGIIREVWHAEKWRRDMDLDLLSPMYDAGDRHFYVNEVAELKDGRKIIPIRWVTFKGSVYADAMVVETALDNTAYINEKVTLVAANNLALNYLDLEHEGRVPLWSDSAPRRGTPNPARMPNPKRVIAGGDPLYTSFVDYFGDDVSGNRSKSWNKHWNAYITHRNLPRELLQQEYHVHFVSSSPNATITEQFGEFKAIAVATQTTPVRVRDASTGTTTRFSIVPHAGPSDNPMQSEICGHIGGQGNFPCRKCEVGGSQATKRENDGFHALFEAGKPRTKEGILAELEKQVRMACSGVAKPIGESQTASGVKDAYTQYWIQHLLNRFNEIKASTHNQKSDSEIEAELIQWTLDNRDTIYNSFLTTDGFDPTKDTPVEILHTILLGIVKYIWHGSHTRWSPSQKQTFALRLQSTNTDGLSIHAIRSGYIMQYAGSLIGRQFKTVVQTSVFHLRGLVTDDQFAAWKAVGELGALLWIPAIHDVNQYLTDIKVAASNVLDIFAKLDPSKIISKIKLHLLSHLPEDIRSFGPLVGVATEIFEAFNAVFRYCSILSNHLAPSRDIAVQLADQEGLKHRLMGGWWPIDDGREWVQAGTGVRDFMNAHPGFQKLMGWTQPKLLTIASIKLSPLPPKTVTRREHCLSTTSAALALNYHEYRPDSRWYEGHYAVSFSAEECYVDSWVFFESSITESLAVGRISGIYQSVVPATPSAIVVIDVYQVSGSRDETYGMPVLTRRNGEKTSVILSTKCLRFKFNAQHDCDSARCAATGRRAKKQERRETSQVEHFIEHNKLDRYFINMHAFHNAHLIRTSLPRRLTAPIPLVDNPRALHDELAHSLRERHAKKKAGKKDQTSSTTAGQKKRRRATQDQGDGRARKRGKTSRGATGRAGGGRANNPPPAQERARRTVRKSWKLTEGAEDIDFEDEEVMADLDDAPEIVLGDSDSDASSAYETDDSDM